MAAMMPLWLLLALTPAQAEQRAKAQAEFEAATALRDDLLAEPASARTGAQYAHVIEKFRAVYHLSPNSIYADPSAYAVAELTDRMGHQFKDDEVLQQAVKQYRFLLHEYPATKRRFESLLAIGNIEANDLHDKDGARAAYQEFLRRFPNHELAAEARRGLESLETPERNSSAVAHRAAAAEPSRFSLPMSDETPPDHATINGIRHWSTPEATMIAIDVDQQVKYDIGEVPGPERVFFDVTNSRLAKGLAGKSYEFTDGAVKRIRLAPYSARVARVVLELSVPADYNAFMLPNPWRIMIEIKPRSQTARTFTRPSASPGDESMVVMVPAPTSRSPFSRPPKPGKADATNRGAPAEAAGTDKPAVRTASAGALPTSAAPGPAAATRTTATALPMTAKVTPATTKSAAPDPSTTLARQAQPTSSGERSLTRALGLKIGRIVIDAGHGGHDTGTVGPSGYCEKDLVLDVALRLGKLLESKMGAEVVYTRDDDTFVPLEERTAIANRAGADLFLSIHANSSPDAMARGVETYYLNFSSSPESLDVAARENASSQKTVHELQDLVKNIALKEKIDESREFAADVQQSLWSGESAKSPAIKNRGVKKAPFIVLIGAHMPSVLAEISFVSNPSDERKLRTPDYRQKIAESLYKGISHYAGGLSGVKLAANTTTKGTGAPVPVNSTQPSH